MKRIISVFLVCAFMVFNLGYIMPASAQEAVTSKIASEAAAKELAASAGGTYVEGSAVPALSGNQVALPVIEESTGQVIGHIVAEQSGLAAALNSAGYTEVAAAVAAAEAGTVAGTTATAGIITGTTVAGAAAAAATVALVVAVADSDAATTHHH